MIEKQISYKYKVYQQFKEDIITGVYSEGEVLNERKLAQSLGISRTPIREALQMLSSEGWIVEEPYKGSTVRTFTMEYVMNAHKVRTALEVLAIEEAIKNIDETKIEIFTKHIKLQEDNLNDYDPTKFMILDRDFHESIYKLTDNEILQELLKNLNDIIRFVGIKVLTKPERSKTTLEEHKLIAQAIVNKDMEAAKAAMKNHMTKTGEAVVEYTS